MLVNGKNHPGGFTGFTGESMKCPEASATGESSNLHARDPSNALHGSISPPLLGMTKTELHEWQATARSG